MSSCCSSHCPVNSKQEKEAWHDTSLFNASGDLKPSCLLSLFQYRTLKIIIHDLHYSYKLVRDAIGLHDSPQSFMVYRVESFFEVNKVCIECCLPLIDLFYDVREDEYLIYCALVFTILYSLDDDSPHYLAGHRQQCHTTPILALFRISSLWYFHYQAFLPLVKYLLLMPYSIEQSYQLLYCHVTICFVQLCWDTIYSRCSSTLCLLQCLPHFCFPYPCCVHLTNFICLYFFFFDWVCPWLVPD